MSVAVRFDELGPQTFAYLMQVGTNRRLAYQNSGSSSSSGFQALVTSPFPVEGLRRLIYETRIAQAIGNWANQNDIRRRVSYG